MNSLQVASFVLLIWQPGQPADVTAAEHWGSLKGEREKRKKANVAQENMPALRGFQELDRSLRTFERMGQECQGLNFIAGSLHVGSPLRSVEQR